MTSSWSNTDDQEAMPAPAMSEPPRKMDKTAREFHSHQKCDGPQSVFHRANDLACPSVAVEQSQAVA